MDSLILLTNTDQIFSTPLHSEKYKYQLVLDKKLLMLL